MTVRSRITRCVFPAGRDRNDQGAVAVLTGILVLVLVGVCSFAVDLGYQRVAARDMQAVADIVAMDMARQLDGSISSDEWEAALADSLSRNQDRTVGDTLNITSCGVSDTELEGATAQICATPGIYDPSDGSFSGSSGSEPATHVRVITRTKVDYFFPIYADNGWVTKTAYASAKSKACYSVGSYALGLATNDSALDGLLNDSLGINLVGYKGLANAHVDLGLVATELSALNPETVVDLRHVKLADFTVAMARVLARTAGSDELDIALLDKLYGKLDATPKGNTLIDLGRLADIETSNGSAVDATVNVLDILAGAVLIADGDSVINVPNLGLSLPGVGTLTTKLKVVDVPKSACNGNLAKTAQVSLVITGDLDAGIPLVASVRGGINITVKLASASAKLTGSVQCVDGVPSSMPLTVSEQTLATVVVDLNQVHVKLLELLFGGIDIPLVNLKVASEQSEIPSGPYLLALPTYYSPTYFGTPQSPNVLSNLGVEDLEALGIDLKGPTSRILNIILNPLFQGVNFLVAKALSPALGLKLAGVDLAAIPTPTCSAQPRLAG